MYRTADEFYKSKRKDNPEKISKEQLMKNAFMALKNNAAEKKDIADDFHRKQEMQKAVDALINNRDKNLYMKQKKKEADEEETEKNFYN